MADWLYVRLSVDWAQLAQQWIQQKDQPGAGAAAGAEPAPTGVVAADMGGGGEADMELDDDRRDDNLNGTANMAQGGGDVELWYR